MDSVKLADKIEVWEIERLRPYDRNSRTHSEDQVAQIAASITEFGFTNPILVDSSDGVVAGHGRLAAANILGLKKVPVLVLEHLSEAQRRAYVIADNKLALNAGWDEKILAAELVALKGESFDLELLGFSEEELAELMPEVEHLPPGGDPDQAPPLPAEPRTRRGDLYTLGRHRLLCGDATALADVDRLTGGKQVDLVFTDPPYGVSFQSGMSKGGTATRFDVLENDDKILDVAPVIWAALANDSAAFIWTSHHVYPEWRQQFSEFYKSTVIWHKPGGGIGDLHGNYATDYEMALFCVKGRPMFRGKRGMAVWRISKDSAGEYVHPTQKPVELAETAINDFTDSGDSVLDLFGGSGSTLIACENTKRRGLIMELDPRYCDVIAERWETFTGKKAVITRAEGDDEDLPPKPAVKKKPKKK